MTAARDIIAEGMMQSMFAPHELPLPTDLRERYLETADAVIEALNDGGFVVIRGEQVEAYERAAKALPMLLLHDAHEEGEARREAYAAIYALKQAGL